RHKTGSCLQKPMYGEGRLFLAAKLLRVNLFVHKPSTSMVKTIAYKKVSSWVVIKGLFINYDPLFLFAFLEFFIVQFSKLLLLKYKVSPNNARAIDARRYFF